MGYWKKHQKKELEQLLCDFDAMGWRVEDPPTYSLRIGALDQRYELGAPARQIYVEKTDGPL